MKLVTDEDYMPEGMTLYSLWTPGYGNIMIFIKLNQCNIFLQILFNFQLDFFHYIIFESYKDQRSTQYTNTDIPILHVILANLYSVWYVLI